MKVVAFITEIALMEAMRTSKAAVVDRIIDHLELTFVADRPQPCSPHGFHEGRRPMSSSRSRSRRPRRAGNIVEYFVIRGEQKSIVF